MLKAKQNPGETEALQQLAHCKQALSDYQAAATTFVAAMEDTQECPAMAQGFRQARRCAAAASPRRTRTPSARQRLRPAPSAQALAALRIRRSRVLAEPLRPPPRRDGWGIYGQAKDADSDEEVVKLSRRRHQKYPGKKDVPPPPQLMLNEGFEKARRSPAAAAGCAAWSIPLFSLAHPLLCLALPLRRC